MANHAGKSGGAVPPLAIALMHRALGPETTLPKAAKVPVQRVRRKRSSRLCVLMNPILPGARSIRTWPAKTMKKSFSCGPDVSGGDTGGESVNRDSGQKAGTAQLTNRRMRTFIAAPSARNVNNTEDPP